MAKTITIQEKVNKVKAAKTKVKVNIDHLKKKDPKLHEAISIIAAGVADLSDILEPDVLKTFLTPELIPIPKNVLTFTALILPTEIRLLWSSDDPIISLYEIREGLVWDTAFFKVRTPSLQADLPPTTTGNHNYLLKTINRSGTYSTDATPLTVTIQPIGSTVVVPSVIDNNVLLSWAVPFSPFAIAYYKIVKDIGGVDTLLGQVSGTFFAILELSSGTFTYKVIPVDIAGNVGPANPVQVNVTLPPDYVITGSNTSTLNGTKINVLLQENGRLLACESDADTWQSHFTSNSWASPQDQINAGYPIYIQPDLLTGSYEEEIDFGSVVNNTTISLTWSANPISGTVGIQTQFYYKVAAGDAWTGPIPGPSNSIPSARYVKFKFTFTPADNKSLVEIWNIKTVLNVRREIDSGSINALASDTLGTQVLFNKSFVDVDSVTATSRVFSSPITVVVDFVDIPHPTGFKVYVFDSSGQRVDAQIDWKARGIT